MKQVRRSIAVLVGACLTAAIANSSYAQEENGLSTEIELGAVVTSGNAENENYRYRLTLDWLQDDWTYQFSSDGFRSTAEDVLTAQRLYHVASAEYALSPESFILTRLAYEDDRFSGFDNQIDFTVSYGRNLLLDQANMDLALTVGAGIRQSKTELETFEEAMVRLGADYNWAISENTSFIQLLSVEAGEDSTIGRSETAIETMLMEALSLRVSLLMKHQTEVPFGREKTDTTTAITLLYRF